ncbi:MAG: hypothetical protein Kow0080_15150 [Candidatus Promineifilaceae bacterium]
MPMKKRWVQLIAFLLLAWLAVSCANRSLTETAMVEVTRVVTETVVEEGEAVVATYAVDKVEAPVAEEVPAERDETAFAAATPLAAATVLNAPSRPVQRLIIKDGVMTLVVTDTDTAVDKAIQTADMMGGYIISQSVYNDEAGYRYATLKLAVPVDRFEEALRAFRGLGTVTNEAVSGTDVTDEFVDLNSRLTNLEATRDRLRSFLEEAQTVEETLTVNEQLKQVEEEIAVIQGRINYLADRSAFSTITLTINPLVPTPTPSPTPTMTPTPTAPPLPTPQVWRPGDTAKVAAVELQESVQGMADFTIYYGIVCGPWLVLMLLVGYGIWQVIRRLDGQVTLLRQESTEPAQNMNDTGGHEDEAA